jgi:hypothetical protein
MIEMNRSLFCYLTLFILILAIHGNQCFADQKANEWKYKGQIDVKVFIRDHKLNWEDWDRLTASNVSFKFQVLPATTTSFLKVQTKYDYVGNTLNGIRVRIQLIEAATATLDPTGMLKMEMPVKVQSGILNTHFNLKLTTEAIPGPEGIAKGRRAHFDSEHNTASLAMVGSATFTAPVVEDSRSAYGRTMTKHGEFLVFVQGEGTVTPEK